MEEEDRRLLLRTLTDDEYRDVMNVCAVMPNVEMIIKSEGTAVFILMYLNYMDHLIISFLDFIGLKFICWKYFFYRKDCIIC